MLFIMCRSESQSLDVLKAELSSIREILVDNSKKITFNCKKLDNILYVLHENKLEKEAQEAGLKTISPARNLEELEELIKTPGLVSGLLYK